MSPGVWIGLAAQLGVSTHGGSGCDSWRLGVSVFLDPSDQSEHVANKVNKKIKTGIRKGQSQYKLNSTKKNQNGYYKETKSVLFIFHIKKSKRT